MKFTRFKAFLAISSTFVIGLGTASGCFSVTDSSIEWAIQTIQKNYYYDIPEETLHYAAFNGGIRSLLDPYSAYYSAREYEALMRTNSGSRAGVGVSITYRQGHGVVLDEVIGNSPAFKAGFKRGDVLTSGKSTSGETVTFDSLSAFTAYADSFETGQDMQFATEHGQSYTVAKAEYAARYAYLYTHDFSYTFNDTEMVMQAVPHTEIPAETAYLRLQQFYGSVAEDTEKLMERFNALSYKTLVLDLRENGGGYVSDMQKIGGCFVGNYEHSPVAMKAIYKDGKEEVYPLQVPKQKERLLPAQTKVYVLADAGTASASEALIGVLYSAGVIDYTDIYLSDYSSEFLTYAQTTKTCRTYGKGIMQSSFLNYRTGECMKLTTAKIYWPNGNCIHDTGVTKEMGCQTISVNWSVEYGDPFLAEFYSRIAA